MKYVKECVLAFSSLISSFCGVTQSFVGIKGGGTVSSILFQSTQYTDLANVSHTDIQKPMFGYYGGIIADFKLGKTFLLRSGIDYALKGWQVKVNDLGRSSTYRPLRSYVIKYLQVPVTFTMATSLANGKVFIGIGSYAAYAINGDVEINAHKTRLGFNRFEEPVFTFLPGENYRPIQFISQYTINRFDFGLNGNIGYEFASGLFFEALVDLGLREISTSHERYDHQSNQTIKDPGSSVRYSIFKIGTGWKFNVKRYRLQK